MLRTPNTKPALVTLLHAHTARQQCRHELMHCCCARCREAARRGGGAFVAPVQRVSDFMERRASNGELPSSSYRLGVRSAPLHDLYSGAITDALHAALLRFDRQMPGFISHSGLLHGVETRTSSPCSIGDGVLSGLL